MKNKLAAEIMRKCQEEQSDFLDLGNCGLREVPEEVFEMTHLRRLNLGRRFFKDGEWVNTDNGGGQNQIHHLPKELTLLQNLKELSLEENPLKTANLLSKFPLLECLNIGSTGFQSLDILKDLSRLKAINVKSLRLRSFSEIAEFNFPNLMALDASNNQLKQLKKLEVFPRLKYLNLSANLITEIKGLDHLKSLKSLYLGLNWIQEIKNLEFLTELEILSFGYLGAHNEVYFGNKHYKSNFIQDIENLEPLWNLKELDLSGNLITTINGLESQTKLESLYLGYNQIKSLEGIKHLKKLRQLSLGYRTPDYNIAHLTLHGLLLEYRTFGNQISQIDGLSSFKELEYLSLDSNQITEIKNLEALTNLRTITLDSNQITEIKNLEALTNLRTITLDFNQITEIKNLEALTNLQTLSLDSNQITEIKNLGVFTNLQTLSLDFNQITEIKNLEALTNLQTLSLNSNQITEIKNLETLINLKTLEVGSNQIIEIENLETLSNLKTLRLDHNHIREIKNLESQFSLQVLWLDNNQITEIKSLEALSNLEILYLETNEIAEIKNLDALLKLDTLWLDSNQITEIKDLAHLVILKALSLDSNQITEIKNLEALASLEELSLGSNQITEIKDLAHLVILKALSLDSNQITEIKNLEALASLEELSLGSNQITEIKNLEALPNLQKLSLGSNQITEIKNLEALPNLQELSLGSNQITEIKNLETLSNLQELSLDFNAINDIENLEALFSLKKLSLDSNKIIEIKNLEALSSLVSLSLSSNQITEIKNLKTLSNLQELLLDSNKITEIKNLNALSRLVKLDLSENNIREIAGVENLAFLQFLYLDKNKIRDAKLLRNIPLLAELQLSENFLSEIDTLLLEGPNIHRIFLAKNEFSNIPSEITNLHNCLPDARAWFKDLKRENVENFEAKLMLVGNGRVGKTSILRRLFQNQFDLEEDSTHGIQLYDQEVRTVSIPHPLRIQAWDFGGQEIYHATHRLFMQSRALYLVLWDWATEHQTFATENIAGDSVKFRNYELTYWLDHARSLSWQSPLMVVQNKIDRDQRKWPNHLNKLQERYSVINFYHVSAATGEGMSVLLSAILEEFRKMPEVGMKTPGQWLRVKKKLLALKSDNKTIDFIRFQKICQEEGLTTSSANALIRFLHNTGNLFYQSDLFQNQIILDQEWALEGMYALFQRGPFYKQLKFSAGRTSLDVLEWPWQNYDLNTRKIFLSMMESCEICFKITEDERDPEYIITEFLPDQKDDKVASFWEKSTENELFLKYQTNFFHPAFISRFIARAGRLAKSFDHIWRNGIWITFENAHALIEAYPDEHQIQIRVKGEPGILLLYLIHNAFREIFYEPDSVQMDVSVAGKDFLRYQELKDGKMKGMKKVLSNSRQMVDLEKVEFFSDVLDARSEDEVKRLADIVPKPKLKASGTIADLTAELTAEALESLKGKLKNEIGSELKKAIESINSVLRNGDRKNQLINIQGRYTTLEKFMDLRKLDFKEYDQNCSQIRSALINLVDAMKVEDVEVEVAMTHLK